MIEKPSNSSQKPHEVSGQRGTIISRMCPVVREETRRVIDNEERVSPTDIQKWKAGAEKYKCFLESLTADEREILERTTSGERINPGALQGVFLGEKPAVFEMYPQNILRKLKAAGFSATADYVYDPAAVREVLDAHPDVFSEFPTEDTHEFMEALTKVDRMEFGVARGLILGFPFAATQAFQASQDQRLEDICNKFRRFVWGRPDLHHLLEEYRPTTVDSRPRYQLIFDQLPRFWKELGISEVELPSLLQKANFLMQKRRFDVYGIQWVDYVDTQESQQKERRLRAAFELSGILQE